jgi:hypothetical protein
MGLACSPDIYQEKMSELFIDMTFVIVYQDDILVLTSGSFDDHLRQLGNIFKRLHRNNLQVNAEKSSFCALETEYLGFILTREGIKPQQQKVNAILQVALPRNVKQVRSFVSMLNHYKAMIPCHSHLLTPLTALTKKNVKLEWTKEHQQAFDLLKNSLACEVVLACPDFSVPFETYTDHKNLTSSNFTTDRVTRWRLIVEEYGPKIVYLPGKCNIIANALSRLPKLDEPHDESAFLEEIFALNEQTNAFPIAFDVISKAQLADNKIQQCITNNDPDFETRIIQRAPLVYFKGKIVIPTNLRFRILTWYHEILLHPGADRMFHTISQHFTWPSLCTQVENFVKHCNTCQHYKAQRKKYGLVPVPDKQQIANPWHSIAVDTIGPWIIPQLPHSLKSKEPTTLQALTIIDLNTHFMEIVALKNKESITIARSLDQVWLCCYPRLVDCLHDNGTEFVSAEFQELLQSYGIQSKLTTVKNPQANGILEHTHQVIGNLLHSNRLIAQDLDTISAQQELLMPVMWAMNTTFHTTLKASPAQLAFSRDMILPTSFTAHWYAINSRKQNQSQSTANAENRKRIPHEFRINDKVLIRRDIGNPYLGKLTKPTQGPFKIIDVQQLPINGTVLIQRSPTSVERVNIRRLLPFFERYN